jgi:hypothetical protein
MYEFHLAGDAHQTITATLCWNRIYSDRFPFEPEYDKDSNLRLEFWAVDPNNPQRNTLLDVSDSVNDNVEHIYFATDPNYSDYQLVVRFSVPHSMTQSYAIAWTAGVEPSAENPFWYDLNNDGVVNTADKLVFFILEQTSTSSAESNQTTLLDILAGNNSQLRLSQSRLQVLKSQWPVWRKHLSKWNDLASGM